MRRLPGQRETGAPFLEGAGETLYKKPAGDRVATPGNGFFPGPVPGFFREEDAYAEKTFSADLSGNGCPSGRAPDLMGGHGRFLQGGLDQQRSPELWNQQLCRPDAHLNWYFRRHCTPRYHEWRPGYLREMHQRYHPLPHAPKSSLLFTLPEGTRISEITIVTDGGPLTMRYK